MNDFDFDLFLINTSGFALIGLAARQYPDLVPLVCLVAALLVTYFTLGRVQPRAESYLALLTALVIALT